DLRLEIGWKAERCDGIRWRNEIQWRGAHIGDLYCLRAAGLTYVRHTERQHLPGNVHLADALVALVRNIQVSCAVYRHPSIADTRHGTDVSARVHLADALIALVRNVQVSCAVHRHASRLVEFCRGRSAINEAGSPVARHSVHDAGREGQGRPDASSFEAESVVGRRVISDHQRRPSLARHLWSELELQGAGRI